MDIAEADLTFEEEVPNTSKGLCLMSCADNEDSCHWSYPTGQPDSAMAMYRCMSWDGAKLSRSPLTLSACNSVDPDCRVCEEQWTSGQYSTTAEFVCVESEKGYKFTKNHCDHITDRYPW